MLTEYYHDSCMSITTYSQLVIATLYCCYVLKASPFTPIVHSTLHSGSVWLDWAVGALKADGLLVIPSETYVASKCVFLSKPVSFLHYRYMLYVFHGLANQKLLCYRIICIVDPLNSVIAE